jgi:spore maturation protein CgeB
MGTYAPDRQPKLEQLLLAPARAMKDRSFIVAGSMYPGSVAWPNNVRHIAHLAPQYHPSLYSSSKLVLNLTRREMVIAGYSPSVRLFEAAACGAIIVSDRWAGMEEFFTPGEEVLFASDGDDMMHYLKHAPDPRIGLRAQQRVLDEHTASARSLEFERAVLLARACASAAV